MLASVSNTFVVLSCHIVYFILDFYNKACWLDQKNVNYILDRMVVGFITTFAISAYRHLRCEFESRSGEVFSIQHYVIKFVNVLSELHQRLLPLLEIEQP
jgi:hypothetical protein